MTISVNMPKLADEVKNAIADAIREEIPEGFLGVEILSTSKSGAELRIFLEDTHGRRIVDIADAFVMTGGTVVIRDIGRAFKVYFN